MCRAFKHKEFDFAGKFLIYGLDQKLSSSKHYCRNFVLKVVRNKKSKFFSHRYLIEFYETNRMGHFPHLYDVVNLLK